MNPEDSGEKSEEKPKKSLSPFLRAGAFEIIFIVLGIFLFFGLLNYFGILSLSQMYPNTFGWLPQRKLIQNYTPNPSLSPTPSGNTISILELTPAATGSSFERPVVIPGTNLALYSIDGRIIDLLDSSNPKGKLLYVEKLQGQKIREPLLAPSGLKPTIVTRVNGKGKETIASVSAILKGDSVIISYNIDIQTKRGIIVDIRISR